MKKWLASLMILLTIVFCGCASPEESFSENFFPENSETNSSSPISPDSSEDNSSDLNEDSSQNTENSSDESKESSSFKGDWSLDY